MLRTGKTLALQNETHKSATSRLLLLTPAASSLVILAARFALVRYVFVAALVVCAITVCGVKRPITVADFGITEERAGVLKDYVRDFGTINRDFKAQIRGAWETGMERVVSRRERGRGRVVEGMKGGSE